MGGCHDMHDIETNAAIVDSSAKVYQAMISIDDIWKQCRRGAQGSY